MSELSAAVHIISGSGTLSGVRHVDTYVCPNQYKRQLLASNQVTGGVCEAGRKLDSPLGQREGSSARSAIACVANRSLTGKGRQAGREARE